MLRVDLDSVIPAFCPHIHLRPSFAIAHLACFGLFSWQSIPDWAKVTCRLLCLWPPLTSGQRPNLPTLTFLQLLGNLLWWLLTFLRFSFGCHRVISFQCIVAAISIRVSVQRTSSYTCTARCNTMHRYASNDWIANFASIAKSQILRWAQIYHVPPIRASHQFVRSIVRNPQASFMFT